MVLVDMVALVLVQIIVIVDNIYVVLDRRWSSGCHRRVVNIIVVTSGFGFHGYDRPRHTITIFCLYCVTVHRCCNLNVGCLRGSNCHRRGNFRRVNVNTRSHYER